MSNLEKYWRVYFESKTPDTRNQLLEQSAELVNVYIGRVRMYLGCYITKSTLTDWGVKGLIQAIDTYEWSAGINFEYFVKDCIQKELRVNSLSVLTKDMWEQSRLLEETYVSQEVLLGREPSDAELLDAMGSTISDVGMLFQYSLMTAWVSMDSPSKPQDKGVLSSNLARVLETLSEQERLLVMLFYYEELTLREISQVLGVTENSVLDLFSRVVLRLKLRLDAYMYVLFV